MKQKLKLLISSIITLAIASSQAIHGIEDSSKPGEDAQRPSRVSSRSDITQEPQQKKRKLEEIQDNPFERCPPEIVFNILERAASTDYLSGDIRNCNLKLVCKGWRNILEQDAMKKSIRIRLAIPLWLKDKDEAVYARFLNGALIYRPTQGSDEGMIRLPIRDLSNPLEGTFDLSKCGDADNHLSISIGYRKEKKPENKYKIEIWIAPRFLIEKEINMTADYFKEIYPAEWNEGVPVGIFWVCGNWEEPADYDYLTTQSMEELAHGNLHEKWFDDSWRNGWEGYDDVREVTEKFHVHF